MGFFEENENIFNPKIINSLEKFKIKKIFCGMSSFCVLEKNNSLSKFYNNCCQKELSKIILMEKEIGNKEIEEICFFRNKNEKIKKVIIGSMIDIFLTSFFFYFYFFIFIIFIF